MLRRLEKLITLINNPKIYEQNFICIIYVREFISSSIL